MNAANALGPLRLLAGSVLLVGGIALLIYSVRAWQRGEALLPAVLGVVATVLGLVTGTVGLMARDTQVASPPVIPTPSAPVLLATAQPTATTRPLPSFTPRPPPPTPIAPLPTMVVGTPTASPQPPAVSSPAAVATHVIRGSPTPLGQIYAALVTQAQAYYERAKQAQRADEQDALLRQAQAIARALLASNPCEYTFQALHSQICRDLDLLGVGNEACAGAPACQIALSPSPASGSPTPTATP